VTLLICDSIKLAGDIATCYEHSKFSPVSVMKRVLFCFDGKIDMVQWIISAFFKQNITVY